jgi:hypothetical protein
MTKVVVIGYHGGEANVDDFVITAVANELFRLNLDEFVEPLLAAVQDSFDMTTRPEKGNAISAIVPGVRIVVALNILGVSKIPGGPMPPSVDYFFSEGNGDLLEKSMSIGALLFCFGAEQPWKSSTKFCSRELAFVGSNLKLYYASYQKMWPGYPGYEIVKHHLDSGRWACDAITHNSSKGCTNPACFKYVERKTRCEEPDRSSDRGRSSDTRGRNP